MKKQIKDLRLKDSVFKSSAGEVTEYFVHSISGSELVISEDGSKYSKETFKMESSDLTRFNFESDGHWKYKFFLSRLDALKDAREYLEENMENIFRKQQKFLENIQEANKKIRECDAEIVVELKNV